MLGSDFRVPPIYKGHIKNWVRLKLDISSLAKLSNQFKKVKGLSPSFFKRMRVKRAPTLEEMQSAENLQYCQAPMSLPRVKHLCGKRGRDPLKVKQSSLLV